MRLDIRSVPPQPPSSPPAQAELDLMPLAPEPPALNDCCGNGCDPCIFDRHDMAMDAYRQALRAWRARHRDAPDHGA